jgi:iron(III) transport system substrate-binding protein
VLRRRQGLVALALVAALVGAGCGDDDDASGSGGGSGTVTIYSGRTQNLIEPILDRFAEATGIDIAVRYGQSADLALLIQQEGDKSPADVFLSQSPGSVGFLDQLGLLGTLPDDALALVPENLRAQDGSWIGFSGRKRVLAYNPEHMTEADMPASVLDLVDPEWKGRIGVAPSNGSFQDFVTAMRGRLGDEATAAWLKGIADNDAFTFANNNAIVAAVGRGEVDLGLVNHYYVYQALAEDPDFAARNYDLPPDDIGSILIVTAATVLKSSDVQDEATQLVKFLLTEESQRYFSDQTYEYPLAAGVSAAEVLPPVEFGNPGGIDFDQLGGDLATTREMIRDAGLEG